MKLISYVIYWVAMFILWLAATALLTLLAPLFAVGLCAGHVDFKEDGETVVVTKKRSA